MKINYVAHLDPFVHYGGGEMIARPLLVAGGKRGHNIRVVSISPRSSTFHSNPDLTILCDVFNCPGALRNKISQGFLRRIIEQQKFIHFDNAYVDCCNMPYLPCNGNTESICPHKKRLTLKERLQKRLFSTNCFAKSDIVVAMYRKAILNVFLSPLHKNTIVSMLGLTNPAFVLKPLIDTGRFANRHLDRDIEYLFAGVVCEAKGAVNLYEFFKDKSASLTTIGTVCDSIDLPNIKSVGKIPYEEMPAYFNRAKNFVYLPRWPEPQGRVVIEAALCGCNLITNDSVGATSFDFNIADPSTYANANDEFWDTLEVLMS